MLAGAHGMGGGGDAMAHCLVAAHALRPVGRPVGSASAKVLCGCADPGLGDARHSGPNPAQAGLTRARRGEAVGGGGPASHRSAAARGERRGANKSAGTRTGADHARRAESGRRESRADRRAGAELRRSRNEPRRDAGTEDAEAQKRESRQNQRERILDRRLIAAEIPG